MPFSVIFDDFDAAIVPKLDSRSFPIPQHLDGAGVRIAKENVDHHTVVQGERKSFALLVQPISD